MLREGYDVLDGHLDHDERSRWMSTARYRRWSSFRDCPWQPIALPPSN